MAGYMDVWKAPDNNSPTPPSLLPKNFNLDPKGVMDQASKINFLQQLPDEMVTKALSGDVASFKQIINNAVQQGFAAATLASGELTKQTFGNAQDVLNKDLLPTAFRRQAVDAALNEVNPAFTNPAVAPMLEMLKSQFMQKYPTATPAQIAAHAQDYLSQMSNMIVTASGGTVTPKGNRGPGNRSGFAPQPDVDWEAYMGNPF